MLDTSHHPHLDGRPEGPHRHDYLADLFPSGTPAGAPPVTVPIGKIIAETNGSGCLRLIGPAQPAVKGWQARVEPPPRCPAFAPAILIA